ncbi:MAG: hypothetical protein DSZ33_03125 [Gammaproteobacteria bacterium]|nr:MAG: hypothetical protein DSZ33_03125 [Gammaproteobacteria bacterium]
MMKGMINRTRLLAARLALLSLAAFAGWAQADSVLLIHGYLSSPLSWERTGVNDALEANGWHRAGIIEPHSQIIVPPKEPKTGKNRVYNVHLPFRQPLDIQGNELSNALDMVESKHPGESVILVGHSAGGLAARMSLVTRGKGNVTRLITIATPHLGTWRARQGLKITKNHGPFNIVKEVVGGRAYDNLKASKPLLWDLIPNLPGNALFWLNRQPHPDIDYVSIIHTKGFSGKGDWIAPALSQDMNQVPPLQGKSAVILLPSGHELSPRDGEVLVDILNRKVQ